MTRGIKHDVDRFINDLQAQYFSYPTHDKNNSYNVQLAVRPVQFWELVFPKEHLQEVQKMIWVKNPEERNELKYAMKVLRKILKAKKAPEFDENTPQRLLYNFNVAIYPVGIREDKDNHLGNEAL